MARFHEPTPEQEAAWKEWVAERPDCVRAIAERFDPWTLYRLTTTNHRVTVVAFAEDGTVRVDITGEFNCLAFAREVFGIDPNTLVECDLPAEGEPLGVILNEAEQLAHINKLRAMSGLPPMAAMTQEKASKA